jgi:hypothetical protein
MLKCVRVCKNPSFSKSAGRGLKKLDAHGYILKVFNLNLQICASILFLGLTKVCGKKQEKITNNCKVLFKCYLKF